MRILGLQLGHNATAALMVDGTFVGAVSQEKFDNIKNSSAFPDDAIGWLLAENTIEPADLDFVAIGGLNVFPHQMLLDGTDEPSGFLKPTVKRGWVALDQHYGARPVVGSALAVAKRARSRRWAESGRNALFAELRQRYGIAESKVRFVAHHACHAYSAYYGLRRDDDPALIVTMDGAGDDDFATVSVVRDGRWETLARTSWEHSLGYVYSHTTKFLGMKPLEHEYKVMGLAPYAKGGYSDCYDRYFKPVIWLRPDSPLNFDSAFPLNRFDRYLDRNVHFERFDNIAGAVQRLAEEVVTAWVKQAIATTGIRDLYTGGGVFMNVKLNMLVQDLDEVDRALFMPSCGDESNPFGAAYKVYVDETGRDPAPLDSLYLGPRYSASEVEAFLRSSGATSRHSVSTPAVIEDAVAELLADGKIVARVADRAEWGARALGDRSILGHPARMETFHEVNDQIKSRDFWMPFAPSMLAEDADKYILNPKGVRAPHMITAFDSTPLGQDEFRAAMHPKDKTLRPQLLEREANPRYYDLIAAFRRLTGIGGLLNTSLNMHGYPLAATLDQALFTFENSGLRYMALEGYLLEKH
jgi:carbamoyltransferase